MSLLGKFIDGVKTLGLNVTLQSALYPLRKRFYSAKFTSPAPAGNAATTYTFAGRVLAHHQTPAAGDIGRQTLDLRCENAQVQLVLLAADLIRVRVRPNSRLEQPAHQPAEPFSYAVCTKAADWPPTPFSLHEEQDALTIRTEKLHCHIDKNPFALTFLDPDGAVICADAAGAGWRGDNVACWKRLPPDERIYGLGQKTTPLDKRGVITSMWNRDPQFYHPGDDPIYANIPFYLGLRQGRGYGIFFDHSARGRFDFGATTPGVAHFEADAGSTPDNELRYYFFYGPQLVDVLDRYTELTGRMIMPPLWALGYHQNRWSYTPDSRVREIAGEFRARHIPCEAIHLDIDYMDGFRCFTWDHSRFPDPAKLIADLHAQHYRVVTMIDPGIKVERTYWVCQEGLEKEMFCRYPDGKLFRGPVWPGDSYFPDFTSPRVRAWWGQLYQGLVDLGVDGFWNDMNEPAIISSNNDTLPDVVQHEYDGFGADHRTAHNVYGMQMARATAEGLLKLRPDERPLVITRSLWAGSQRYNMHWLGDNYSDWPSLRNTMQLVMNLGLSGIAFTGPDTGGFVGTPDGELMIRWNQMSVFTPFFRNHTVKNSADQEPWAFGQACERLCREFITLRYRLLPYIYTAFWQSAQRGLPMARPLFLQFQDDERCYDIDDEYMFGDAFLVAPIYEQGARSRRVYIPAGQWYDYWRNTITAGPQITRLDAPIHQIPLLVRAGSVVPAWPDMQYIGEKQIDTLTLHVYPGNGVSWLYQDDGRTWAFRDGAYRLTRFVCKLGARLEITREVTQPVEQIAGLDDYARIRIKLHGLAHPPAHVHVDDVQIQECKFEAENRTAILETGPFTEITVELAPE